MLAVTSTVRNTDACGAAALATIAAAVRLRTPRTGVRSSPVPVAATVVVPAGAAVAPDDAASTSSRVMRPCGPVPVIAARSRPRWRASARTTGVERGRSPFADGADATPFAEVAGTAVVAAGAETTTGTSRRRRRAGRPVRAGRAPYPTRFGSGLSSPAETVELSGPGARSGARGPDSS